jgi:uncharacterized protein
VKLYANEAGYRQIRALEGLVVSALVRVEVPSALWRKVRMGELEEADARVLLSAFELDFHGEGRSGSRFAIVALKESVLVAAAGEAAAHGLRAYDAVQLASAMAVRELDPRCSHFACFDTDLRGAASRSGFFLTPERT